MDISAKRIISLFFLIAAVSVIVVMAVIPKTQSLKRGRMLPQQALIAAEQTPEVQALYKLQEGRLFGCVEKKVLRPCDSQWVTCIEEAWVVEFNIGEACQLKHDGRLNIHILVDSKDGRIISRFPEAPYFQKQDYCHEPYDCFCSKEQCVNFVYGQIGSPGFESCKNCSCQENVCSR